MVVAAALLLTILTGFAGLVYEVAWQKYLASLLGNHSAATAAVLAIFLGGLSVGYAGFGRLSRWLVQRRPEDGTPVLRAYEKCMRRGTGFQRQMRRPCAKYPQEA